MKDRMIFVDLSLNGRHPIWTCTGCQTPPTSLFVQVGVRGVVYYGNGYACYVRAARCRTPRDAGQAYIAEHLHWAMGQADMPSFSDFQKLISR